MHIDTMEKLFIEEMRDVYSAEKQILKALPLMAEAATSADLQEALQQHLEVTEQQVERLDRIFEQLAVSPNGKKCKGMAGLLEEGAEILKKNMEPELKDAALISSAQRVEHYEISAYGTLCAFAERIGATEAAALLQQTLEEEKEADEELTQIAESSVNAEAAEVIED